MTEPIAVRTATGRREIRLFVDYMYERNAGDPHWVPPLRLGEHERLNPKKNPCLLYTSPSPRDGLLSRMPSSA